ncbi:MAG TPA: hypothetical protein VK177_08470 [Flavobacteriales bacterium]|nr:hypothetical protein [Flavobacteriales bacterium]
MTRNKRRITFSFIMLAVLVVAAYFTAKQNGMFDNNKSANNAPDAEFAIADTGTIDKFIITKSSGERATLTRDPKQGWMINGKFRAKPESILLLMKTFKNVRPRVRVGTAARNNVIKSIAAYHRKIEIFQNGELSKIWYVSNPAADRSGTYMLLETPEMGKSSEPYIMELVSFHGQLDTRFFTEEREWKYSGIFTSDPKNLQEIKVESAETPQEGFTLIALPGNKLELRDYKGNKVNGFDTLTARAYMFVYKKIHFEETARLLTFEKIDSLRKHQPWFRVSIKDAKTGPKSIDLYHMPNKGEAVDLEGKLLPWNPERAYGLVSNGDVVVVQLGVFDKVLRPISAFIRKMPAL